MFNFFVPQNIIFCHCKMKWARMNKRVSFFFFVSVVELESLYLVNIPMGFY